MVPEIERRTGLTNHTAKTGDAMSHTILCPNCSFQIEISDALSAQLREQLRKEFEADARRRESAFARQEEILRERERALEESRRSLETELAERVAQERDHLQEDAQRKA